MEKKIVVVAPTYNEEENISTFIEEVLKYPVALVISDSHSTDRTPQIVKKYKNVYYLDVKKRGLGLGLSKGLDYAVEKLKADALITMEADLSCDPKQIPEFIKKLDKTDAVIGSRYVKGGKITNWTWWRKYFSLTANLILKFLAWTKVSEFTNLYRAFTKEVWLNLKPKIGMHLDWIFVPAFAFEVLHSKFKVVELPIKYFDRYGGRSKMKTLSYTRNLLHYAFRYRINRICQAF